MKDLYSAGVESTSDMRIDSFQIGKSSGALVRRFGFIFWCVALGGQNVKNPSVLGVAKTLFFRPLRAYTNFPISGITYLKPIRSIKHST